MYQPGTIGYATWVASLDAHLTFVDDLKAQVAADPEFGADLPWPVFLRCMRLVSAQSAGPRMQNRLARDHGWTLVPASMDRGDVVDADGQYHEVKVTFVTGSNRRANFVQLRPHQDISGYHLFVVDEDMSVCHLYVPKDAMARELATIGSVAHGTAAAVAENTTVEYAIRILWTPTDAVCARWVSTYQVP